ncbi:MAG: hypothetical protein ABEL97_10995 [Salinibacter sp.]
MKRLAAAGTFALIGGAAALLMVASILYSCRQGGQPHDMGFESWAPEAASAPTTASAPLPGRDRATPKRAARVSVA